MLCSYDKRFIVLGPNDRVVAVRPVGFLASWRRHLPAYRFQWAAVHTAWTARLADIRSSRQVGRGRL